MFTGIIEEQGIVTRIEADRSNKIFTIKADLAKELRVDQSLAHDGVCLTVTKVNSEAGTYTVTAIDETLKRSTLGTWSVDSKVNLERCMLANGRFDGHIVQGHIDQTAQCSQITDENGSWRFRFVYDKSEGSITVPKGSVTVNGVSLTVVDPKESSFEVAIIPYTMEHTNFGSLSVGGLVNLEFDIVGKYIQRLLNQNA